jgi:hypothetical protein
VRSLRKPDNLCEDTRALKEVVNEDKQWGVFVACAPKRD